MTLRYLDEQIAEALLDTGAVSLRPKQPFTWTSGLKSPIYCDNRITISHPSVRDLIALGFAEKIREVYPDAEVLAGIATGGIPHAAFVAQKLNLPMIYVRDKAKGHGKENVIEGLVKPGQKVVMIEDLISTGGSSVKAASAVRDFGANVLGVIAIFNYQLEKAVRNFAEADFAFDSLSNYSALIDVALKLGKIAEEDVELLRSWRTNPDGYGV
ncbi:orotate phosphoribosyltransferase [Paenibacillus ginsengarvi]|uniref:Orotate phosphoribosyltransferase n=1 Tax=Paenibacillus ginsengarvi TaxID=400777 RepID=A0A3B0CWP0_9BACL|nr:orotate phosphoribosyltransferase [Paenibacillus ginsengarvi]RKN86857.1 orotate phosphoribosyltransferase [Paenibacillus ginsengarvi]